MASIFKLRGRKGYQISFKDANGLWKRVKGCTDYTATKQIAAKLEAEAELRRRGVIDPMQDQLAQNRMLSIEHHLKDFKAWLGSKGSTADHVERTLTYVRKVCTACSFERLASLHPHAVSAHVSDLCHKAELGPVAINKRLTALKTFTGWLLRNGRLAVDPMAQVSKLNDKVNRRHERRALTDSEIVNLLQATANSPERLRLTGSQRAILYRMALETGLRRSELRSLTPESFDLSNLDYATVSLKAAYSKHRRDDVLPIRRELAEVVGDYMRPLKSGERLFVFPDRIADALQADLKAAEVPYKTSAGVCDFHALRHTFITRLARSGVSPAVAKTLARHSTITLTMDHYTHLRIEDTRAALKALIVEAPVAKPQTAVVVKTGTGPVIVINDCHNGRHNTGGFSSPDAAERGNSDALVSGRKVKRGNRHKLLRPQPFGTTRQQEATGDMVPKVGVEPTRGLGPTGF